MSMEKFNANDVVWKEGDPADRLYVIMEGSVEIVVQVSVGCASTIPRSNS